MMKNLRKLPLMATLLFTLLFNLQVHAKIVYVDSAAVGISDGSTWENAFTGFQAGIDAAGAGDTVWVAKGTYQPAISGQSFSMKSGVKIFGGFVNTATLFSERDWKTNCVILHGNNESVFANSGVDAGASLDGFTVTGGISEMDGGGIRNSGNVDAVFANLLIKGNVSSGDEGGGGMYNLHSTVTLTNVTFYNNSAGNGGGGLLNAKSISNITNSVFWGNTATAGTGGAVANFESTDTLTNVTFCKNSANKDGGGLSYYQDSSTITNCVFWGNSTSSGSTRDVFDDGTAFSTVNFCLSQMGFPGNNNTPLAVSPFVNAENPAGPDGIFMTADDGLQLLSCSRAVNSGDNAANTATTDITGQPRLYDTTQQIDRGAYEYQGTPEDAEHPSMAINADTVKQIILDNYDDFNAFLSSNSCRVITGVLPYGPNPVKDSVTSKVWVDSTVQSYNGHPYMQRHFEITPETNAATATAYILLPFTKAEFDTFNAKVHLPAGPEDPEGLGNLRLMQFHGTSATGTPGTYSGSTELIEPFIAAWNSDHTLLSLGFLVTGFSGFIVTTDPALILPLDLLSFNGQLVNGKSQLNWKTAVGLQTHYFDVEKSTDGIHFILLTKVSTKGTANTNYATVDAQTQSGNNYYRLKIVDNDGKFAYSNIVLIKVGSNAPAAFLIYPNPVKNQLVVQYDQANSHAQINIYSLDGRKISTRVVTGLTQTTIDVSHLMAGTYMIEFKSDTEMWRNKFVKVN